MSTPEDTPNIMPSPASSLTVPSAFPSSQKKPSPSLSTHRYKYMREGARRIAAKTEGGDPLDPQGEAGAGASPTSPTPSTPLGNEGVPISKPSKRVMPVVRENIIRDGKVKVSEVVKRPSGYERDKKTGQVNLNFTLSPKQLEAQEADSPFLLYGGAKGGGKSWWLCVWVFLNALKYPGNKLFFCRRRSVDFTNTTLETWKKAIPAEMYRINEHKKKIYIPLVNSVIDYGGLDDPLLVQSLNSAEYAQIGVDQAEEVERDQFSMLRGTLRHRLPDGTCPPYQIRMTANPAQCWLKDDFLISPREGFKFVSALPTDNPYLPKDYTNNLAEAFKHRPSLLAAYLHGSWDDLASHDICIQSAWVRDAVRRDLSGVVQKRVICNDPARFGDDENVIYVLEETERGITIVHQEIMEHKSLMDTAGRLAAMRRKYEANLIGVDVIGIGSGIVDALIDLGEPVLAINSSNKPSIETFNKKYFNMRSQIWGEAAIRFANHEVSIPDDPVLKSQLASVRFTYQIGKMKIESKDDIKERSVSSPDRADDCVMGIYTISKADRLDHAEYLSKTSDRVGHGIPVESAFAHEEGVGADMEFSGY